MRHDRAKIGLAGQHDRPPFKNYFEPWIITFKPPSCFIRKTVTKTTLDIGVGNQGLRIKAGFH